MENFSFEEINKKDDFREFFEQKKGKKSQKMNYSVIEIKSQSQCLGKI